MLLDQALGAFAVKTRGIGRLAADRRTDDDQSGKQARAAQPYNIPTWVTGSQLVAAAPGVVQPSSCLK
jgi:hypothetical protein